MDNLDGKLVRVVDDLLITTDTNSKPEMIVESGTEFVWDDSTTDQNIGGILVFVDPDEVELVE
jgi:hypothetical protein